MDSLIRGSFVHVWLWTVLLGVIYTCLVMDSIIRVIRDHLFIFGDGQYY